MAPPPDVTALLGATTGGRSVPILLFIPSKDRDGSDVDQAFWVEEALATLGQLFGGGTALPMGRGSWWDEQYRRLLHEDIVVIFSLVTEDQVEDAVLIKELGVFLRRMGRETRQGEVAVVIDSDLHKIHKYD